METFFIEQFGCRATQADAAAIERQLCERGLAASPDVSSADVVVVNTCTVTAAADLQARQAIHKIHRGNPAARIVVTGCYAQRAPEDLARLKGVAWVVGNSHTPEIPRLIEEMTPVLPPRWETGFVPLGKVEGAPLSLKRDPAKILTGNIFEQRELLIAPVEGGEAGHTRPVLKIQDGCDSRCSYCVIPQVRGPSRSLAPDRVIAEIRKLAAGGAREVVLSGIDLGSYGRNLKPRAVHRERSMRTELGELLRRILDETPIERLRISSIEPTDVTEDLIALFAASERLARHFHMPLQSGSNRLLAAMHRWYRAEHYARRAELVREWLPDAAIGADVIAGFPGETEEDYRATLALVERLPLTYLHVFSFSPRPGTPAAEMQDRVSSEVITRRAQALRALGEEKKTAFRAAQAGRTLRVLTLNRDGEDASGPWTRALSGNYVDVRVAGRWPANQMLGVRIHSTLSGKLMGQPVPASA
ncbi:MAG: tRNA (N(6)-L-threonylcarbamoyladenosine(37)-C(2))-methylthiotransferase MtaB [Acidobacteriia bacterium]|nr:tRNA (N(6)-L-threonylcarbamoyladenosine(37)-C(2))-methylthiotransferase MtaB [Terriglobia bacterium]